MKKALIALLVSVSVIFAAGCLFAEEENVLNLYNWPDYLPESVLKQFTAETGIEVKYSVFENNEVMFAKLKESKSKGYDVVVPSTYYISRMGKEGMLMKLDKSKLPNLKNLDSSFLNQSHDPDNQFSVPYVWGTTGIAVNSKLVEPGSVKKWEDLWDPQFKNTVFLLDDMRDVFSVGLKLTGHSINDTDESHIQAAYLKLKDLLPNVKVFHSESPKTFFVREEVALGMNWNGDTVKAGRENSSIAFVYPSEGCLQWMDSLAIPSGTEHAESAYKFINFLLRPEIAGTVSREVGYATPNSEALKLLPPEVRDNPVIYPPRDELKNAEFQLDVGDAAATYEKYWEMLKTGK